MKRLILGLILIAAPAFAGDQKVLDFCHEYIGEAIKKKPDSESAILTPGESSRAWVYPLYKSAMPVFSNYSVYPDARR